jgi:hypothetical protein
MSSFLPNYVPSDARFLQINEPLLTAPCLDDLADWAEPL